MNRKTIIDTLHECLKKTGAEKELEEMATSFAYLVQEVYGAMELAADRLCDEKTWKKVKDEKPEDNTVVVTFYELPEFHDGTTLTQVCPYSEVAGGFDMHNGHRVTHWRPLPANPED